VTTAVAARPQQSIRFRGRSFMAFVLSPLPPIVGWLAELDNWNQNSPGFFIGRPIILDLAAATLDHAGIANLIAELGERGIKIVGLEGADPDRLGPSLPPLLKGGKQAPTIDDGAGAANVVTLPAHRQAQTQNPTPSPAPNSEPTSLLLESPVRSGQSVIFPNGDVTVMGAIASGAEVVAGGSIHVYGTLRGRAMAGAMGNAHARIFCRRNEAELISIDGYYRTAEEMDANLRGRATQCWLEDRVLSISALD
jgi:septum site-determining protein MinC